MEKSGSPSDLGQGDAQRSAGLGCAPFQPGLLEDAQGGAALATAHLGVEGSPCPQDLKSPNWGFSHDFAWEMLDSRLVSAEI